jgi:uncharacterized protein involved in exopolysaccharide biosynthesis
VTTTADDVAAFRRDEIDVIAVGQFLSRYRLWIAGIALLGGVLAALLAIVSEPIYRAEVSVTPVRNNSSIGQGTSLAGQLGGLATLAGVNLSSLQAGQGEEALAVLESRRLAEAFVEQHGLKEPLLEGRGSEQTLWYAVERFEDAIMTIRTDPLRRITTVSIDWRDPTVAAEWANGFVSLANESLRERALTESERSIEYLNAQLEKTTVVELKRVMYNLIENEMQKLVLANARTEYAFTVVDPAVAPEEKTSPRPLLMVSFGLLIGTVLGLMLAFFSEVRRKRRTARA